MIIVDYCRRLSVSVTYHHKRDSCAKETREILDNILQMKKSDYEILEPSSESSASKPADHEHEDSADGLSSEENAMEQMESYESTQEIDVEAEEVKDHLEKKKKRRNYVEFRPDYEKS